MRDNRERLLHIVEAIERIGKYASKGMEVFYQDELIQNWIIHHIQVIGEAARALRKISGNSITKFPGIVS